MKALLVIDAQNAIIEFKDFTEELARMEHIIEDFKENNAPVIFIRHVEAAEDSPFSKNKVSSALHYALKDYADFVIEKTNAKFLLPDKFSRYVRKIRCGSSFYYWVQYRVLLYVHSDCSI